MHDQRVLVTGGAGFIGSNLANRLAADNDVIAVDDTYLGTPENLDDNVEFVEADVIDDDFPPMSTFCSTSPRSPRGTCTRTTLSAGCRVNVEGFVNAVERARQEGCETVVYASTSSIYGNRTEPSPVDMDVEARTAYEASKLARERYAEYYGNYHDMAMAGLRFFSVYQGFGATRNTKASTRTRLRSSRTRSRTARPELFGDGSQTRDFTHVSDVARACELAADHELTGVYNVGTEEAYSFNEMVAMINDALGTDIDPVYIECPSTATSTTPWRTTRRSTRRPAGNPEIGFEEGVELVCELYSERAPRRCSLGGTAPERGDPPPKCADPAGLGCRPRRRHTNDRRRSD